MAKLKRTLGLFAITLYGVGIILGAGIYALIGEASKTAGNSLWISFIIGALLASLTGLSYCELSSIYPKSAAEYVYVKKAFKNDLISFLIGWLIICVEIISASAVALGFGGYFHELFPISTNKTFSITLIAILLIVVLSFLNFYGIEESAKLNITFTIIEALGLLFIIFIGLGNLGKVNYLEAPFGISGIFSAATLIFFAYIGFENIVNLAEETKKPTKTLPKATILAITITSLLYILVSISAISTVSWQELASSKAPLALVASKAIGKEAFFILWIIALFATANTVLVILIVGSRMIYGMAKHNSLPKFLAHIHKKRRTPYIAIMVFMLFSILFTLTGEIEIVAMATSIGTLIIFAFVNASVIKLRFSKSKIKRPFKIPLNIGKFPLLSFIGLTFCIFLILQSSLIALVIIFSIILTGCLAFYAIRKKYAPAGI
ncbi:MAG: amino acid permease [Candidatus Aenigmatarchaeota archaeon]